mgnify:FL=1
MALFVHITKECEKQAEIAGSLDILTKFKSKIQNDDLDLRQLNLQYCRDGYYIKARFPFNKDRLIITTRSIEGNDIIVFIIIYSVASNEFKKFNKDPKCCSTYIEEKLIKNEISNKQDKPKRKGKPRPRDIEVTMLSLPFNEQKIDIFISESSDWVDGIRKKQVRPHLSKICDIVNELLTNDVYKNEFLFYLLLQE